MIKKAMRLGDIDIARIVLGTNRLTKTRENIALIKAAVAAGVKMIDTAHSYTGGQSEETIGEALSPIPEVIQGSRQDPSCRISEVGIEQIERARQVVPIAAVQNHYNLSERKYEAVVDYCAGEGIVFVPFFPLRGDGGPALAEIAKRHTATPPQITLAWLLRRSPAMLPIPGTLSLEHLKENLAASKIELSDREFEAFR
jgi:aryl-alcohol dehydrogenase-like predicted oxidoreductase